MIFTKSIHSQFVGLNRWPNTITKESFYDWYQKEESWIIKRYDPYIKFKRTQQSLLNVYVIPTYIPQRGIKREPIILQDLCLIPHDLRKLCNFETKGNYMLGVTSNNAKTSNKFQVQYVIDNKQCTIGYYETELEAHLEWKQLRINEIQSLIKHYKRILRPHTYNSLKHLNE